MKYSWSKKVSLSTMVLTVVSGAVFAQTGTFDAGKDEYNTNCAVCHGTDAKGKGPYSAYLRSAPTDLTTLSKRNGGVLPVNRLYQTIEGADVPSHGTRDMPIWGGAYRAEARDYLVGPNQNRDGYVRSRILTLIDYINRVQLQ